MSFYNQNLNPIRPQKHRLAQFLKKHLTLADRVNLQHGDVEAGPHGGKVFISGVEGHRDHVVVVVFSCGRDVAVGDVGVADVVTRVLQGGDDRGGEDVEVGHVKNLRCGGPAHQVGRLGALAQRLGIFFPIGMRHGAQVFTTGGATCHCHPQAADQQAQVCPAYPAGGIKTWTLQNPRTC